MIRKSCVLHQEDHLYWQCCMVCFQVNKKVWTKIQHIAQTNNFLYTLIQKLNSQLQQKHKNYDRNNNIDKDKKENLDNVLILQPTSSQGHHSF